MTKEEFIKIVYKKLYNDKIHFSNYDNESYHAWAEDWDHARNEPQNKRISKYYNTYEELIDFMVDECKKLLEEEKKEINKLILSVSPFS